jgi:hypothetical protein
MRYPGLLLTAALMLAGREASAQMIIKNPGQHPQGPEIEPHLLLRPLRGSGEDSGVGLGGRFTWQIGKNNFIDKINNSVGIGVGVDWVRYSYRYKCGRDDVNCRDSADWVLVPVVMQWSFYLSRSWSVFGEPGIMLGTHFHDCQGDGCPRKGFGFGRGDGVDFFILHVGGRWHFKENMALTLRIGWPYFSAGVSFL